MKTNSKTPRSRGRFHWALALLALPQAPQDPIPVTVLPQGEIAAPRQPERASSSIYRRTSRNTPVGASNAVSRIRTPIAAIVAVRGQEDNSVSGYGLIDGLAGTGDSGELARQLLRNMLLAQDINIDADDLSSGNLAVVRVEATVRSGMKAGTVIDARVSAIGDATSLVGGTLTFTELRDPSSRHVYATSSGPVTVGGFSAQGEAASATKNHTTVGMLPSGAKIQREVPTRLVSELGFLYLDAKPGHDTFGNMVRVVESINHLFPGVAASQPGGKSVRVEVPVDIPTTQHLAYLDTILRQEVVTDNMARVVLNERTGVIVMGGDVRLRPGAITHGGLFVTIAETAEASQPGPLSGGATEQLERTDIAVEEENNGLVLVPGAVTLGEVVEVLNVLGATPRDMMSILTAMNDGGLLVADIRRM
ncbi:MAG: flagellar basal body P-ring protein FlgI [bacterium]|nr:flagellar basal body P-ring protein FlgI [bacterium]